MHLINRCMKRTTTDEILKNVMDNYNKGLMEMVAILIEKSRNRHLKRASIMRVMLSYYRIILCISLHKVEEIFGNLHFLFIIIFLIITKPTFIEGNYKTLLN